MRLPTPIKTDNPTPWGLLPSEKAHTLSVEWVSPRIKLFTLLWLSLEFFPLRSQKLTLGSRPRVSSETWDVTVLLLLAKNLAFFDHQNLIKNTETEFGGNRKVVLFSVGGEGSTAGTWLKNCPPSSMRSLGAYIRWGLTVRSRWWGTKMLGSWFLPLKLFQRPW